jgi:hypothetical protein
MKRSLRGDRTKNQQSDKRDYMRGLNFDGLLMGWVLKVDRFQLQAAGQSTGALPMVINR